MVLYVRIRERAHCCDLPQHHAKGPNIAFTRVKVPPDSLDWQPAQWHFLVSRSHINPCSWQSKVGYFQSFLFVYQNVSGRQISMGYLELFQVTHSVGDLNGELLQLVVVEDVFQFRVSLTTTSVAANCCIQGYLEKGSQLSHWTSIVTQACMELTFSHWWSKLFALQNVRAVRITDG